MYKIYPLRWWKQEPKTWIVETRHKHPEYKRVCGAQSTAQFHHSFVLGIQKDFSVAIALILNERQGF